MDTTITESGRTQGTRVEVGSGDRRHDRGAKRYLDVLDFSRLPLGVALGQTGDAAVRVTGPEMYSIDVTGGQLLAACPAPSASPPT